MHTAHIITCLPGSTSFPCDIRHLGSDPCTQMWWSATDLTFIFLIINASAQNKTAIVWLHVYSRHVELLKRKKKKQTPLHAHICSYSLRYALECMQHSFQAGTIADKLKQSSKIFHSNYMHASWTLSPHSKRQSNIVCNVDCKGLGWHAYMHTSARLHQQAEACLVAVD